jgi:hypothetical protein
MPAEKENGSHLPVRFEAFSGMTNGMVRRLCPASWD